MTDREPTRPDPETLRAIADEVETVMTAAARLQELGEDAGTPAIERNAKRLEGVAATLADNVPPELQEE